VELGEVQAKFRDKDSTYKKCLDSRKQKQGKLEALKKGQKVEEKRLKELEDQISGVQLPQDADLTNKEEIGRFLAKVKEMQKRLAEQIAGVDEVQAKVSHICQPLADLPQEIVGHEKLQAVLEELNKLDILLADLNDDLSGASDDREALEKRLHDFIQGNKNKYLDDTDRLQQLLAGDLQNLDKDFVDLEKKLGAYQYKLKDGMRVFAEEEDILGELKTLKGEADGIDQRLKKLENRRRLVGARERQLRDTLNKYKGGKVQPSAQDIAALAHKFRELQEECADVRDGLTDIDEDLDLRIAYLDKFLKKGKQLQELFKQYGDASKKLDKDYD